MAFGRSKAQFVRREILKGLSGVIHPARLTAVMGASGAGKTTLVNVLVGVAPLAPPSPGHFG